MGHLRGKLDPASKVIPWVGIRGKTAIAGCIERVGALDNWGLLQECTERAPSHSLAKENSCPSRSHDHHRALSSLASPPSQQQKSPGKGSIIMVAPIVNRKVGTFLKTYSVPSVCPRHLPFILSSETLRGRRFASPRLTAEDTEIQTGPAAWPR